MRQTDFRPQSGGENQSSEDKNNQAWQKNMAQQDQNEPIKISITIRIGRAVAFLVKWLWLLTMFVVGIVLCLLMTNKIFEYSYSLFELDLAESLFFVGLVLFVFHYLKLCYRSDVPLVRKIIMPFVHQSQITLVAIFVLGIFAKANNQKLEDYANMPLLDLADYILTMITLGYSYYWVADMDGNNVLPTEPEPGKAANNSSDDLNHPNQKGEESVGQGDSVSVGGAQ